MQKLLQTWQLILKSLQENTPVMLLYVVESKGSSPGRQGFAMAVNANNRMEGSIGGGIMEHKFVEMAKERLKVQAYRVQELRKQIHDKSAATEQSGMICSGEQTILLYPVLKKDVEVVQQIISSLGVNKNGELRLSSSGISFSGNVPASDFSFAMRTDEDWEYIEKTGYKNQLFIIGGGHCALAFSRLMRGMDFYITLYEEREGLYTVLQNEFAHEVMIVDDYTALSHLIPAGPNQYVVIMTFGYRTDDIALRSLLTKTFNYLGVLGSKKKMEKLFEEYRKDGFPEEALQRIHTPIGLDIKSQTPEEIAVSIAAEIIKTKNQQL
ncbi:MAG TPA: XdhC family protein [Chitinophagaceae bacterium]|nr:XdhC family protein [Chitinophagaceae bacterium]